MEKSFAEQLKEIAQVAQSTAYKEQEQARIRQRLFEIKLEENAKAYVEYAKAKAQEAAKKGCGRMSIKIDKTYDIYSIDEGFPYEVDTVTTLLSEESFTLDYAEEEDHFDAFTVDLVWDFDLPKSDDKIKMRPE